MISLEEAIKHCEEKIDSTECGMQHKQLAEWLKELKKMREHGSVDQCILHLKRNGYVVKNSLRICRWIQMNVLRLMRREKVKIVQDVRVLFV